MSTPDTATAPAPTRVAHRRRYLMCRPEHFTVEYKINPWMEPATPTDTAKAVEQWQKLHDLYLELGHEVELIEPLAAIPDALSDRGLRLSADGRSLAYEYDTRADRTGIARLLGDLAGQGIMVRDVSTRQSSLEEVFMTLVAEPRQEVTA